MPQRLPIRYEVSTYAGLGAELETRSMTPEQLRSVDLKAFDHALRLPSNLLAYRNSKGEWIERPLEGSGLGQVCLDILECIQLNPSIFMACGEIAELTGNENLAGSNTLAARVRVIRKTHGESPRSPWFIASRRRDYALLWPAERSWIRISRITAQPAGDAA